MYRACATLLVLCAAALSASAAREPPAAREARLLIERHFRQSGEAIQHDAELSRVASANSEALAETGPRAPAHAGGYLRFLLERHGVRDAVTQAIALRLRPDELPRLRAQLLAFLRQRAAGGDLSHFGVGFAEVAEPRGATPELARGRGQTAIVTVILVRRRVTLSVVRASARQLRLCSQLLSGRRPRVYATLPSGQIIERLPSTDQPARRFCLDLPAAARGRYQVEIMVDGPLGPEVAALFPLYVGVEPPALPEEKLYPPSKIGEPRAVEQRLLALLNRSRAAARVPPLRACARLAVVARVHSSDMMEGGFFGHRDPLRGSLATRLAAEGIEDYSAASENLALSTGPNRAHDALLASPSHRKNLLDPRMTHVGIGALQDRENRLLYITQCFARLPDPAVCQ